MNGRRAAGQAMQRGRSMHRWLVFGLLLCSTRAGGGEGEVRAWERPVPERITTTGQVYPGSLRSGDPLSAARSFLSTHAELFPPEAGSLALEAHKRAGRLEVLTFRQCVGGVPIHGSRVDLRIDDAGRVVLYRADLFLDPADPKRPIPRRESSMLVAEGSARIKAAEGLANPDRWVAAEQVLIPERTEGGLLLSPAWGFSFRTTDPPGDWDALVDATTGRLLVRENRIPMEMLTGRIRALVEPNTAGDPLAAVPLPFASVAAEVQGDAIGTGVTDSLGSFAIDVGSASSIRVRTELRGRAVWVRDASRGLSTPLDTITTAGTSFVDRLWTVDQAGDAARDAYIHAHEAWRMVRALDPGPSLAALDSTLELRVDDPTGHCNAYWRGDYFNFYGPGGGCPGIARIRDVVYHEYAHAVTQYCYAPFSTPPDLNEGLSDYFAASATGRPEVGLGWRGPGSRLREIETNRVWPDDRSPDPHIQGLILAGALWDMRTALGRSRADSLFHFARYGAPQTMDDFLLEVLAQDDVDGDLRNGTPHFAPIVNAFLAHGIGDTEVRIETTPLPDVESAPAEFEVQSTITSLLGLDPDSLVLYWADAAEGPWTPARLSPSKDAGRFIGRIPAPAGEARIHYWIAASDTAGHASRLPEGAPAETYTFLVGADHIAPEILSSPIEVIPEDLDSLRIRATVTDNSARLGRIHAVFRREGHSDSTIVTMRPAGDPSSLLASLPLDTLEVGTYLSYQIVAEDAAAAPNRSRFPAAGPARVSVRRGWSFSFEADQGASESSGDWTWGTPRGGAFSGARAWMTGAAGQYSDDTVSRLILGPFDLSGLDRARLEFQHRYRFEDGYDGARALASTDAGNRWRLLVPDGGYPYTSISAVSGAGWSGASDGWQGCTLPLDAFLGHEIWIALEAASDAYVTESGWVVDDLALVAAQCRSRPASLRALGGEDARIALEWTPPGGIDRSSPRFHGFDLYRAADGDPWPASPLAGSPFSSLSFIDRDVTNGTRYRYRLSAAYDEGESAALEATAVPYAASLGVDVEEIHYVLRGEATSDTTFLIRNLSGGNLHFSAFLAAPGATLDSVRVRCRVPGAGEPAAIRALTDAADARRTADLRAVDIRGWDDPELGPMLEFVLRGHRTWEDPLEAWGGVLLLDTDQNLVTSQGNLDLGWDEGRNLGWEHGVIFGRLLAAQGSPAAAATFDPSGNLTPAYRTVFPSIGDSIAFSVPLHTLGDPTELQLEVVLATARGEEPIDRAPEIPDLRWVEREPRGGRALVDHPQPFSLEFDANPAGNGVHRASLFLETNDRAHPVLEVPITLEVRDFIPSELAQLALRSDPEGMDISFSLPSPLVPRVASIERRLAVESPWARVGPDSLFPDAEGRFHWLDDGVVPNTDYLYRFRVLPQDATIRQYGPFPARYDPPVPDRLALHAPRPSPFSGTTMLRLDLPSRLVVDLAVYDVTGRRLAVLVSGVQERGIHRFAWDGRDAGGRDLPSGTYFLRLHVPGSTRVARVLKVR